MSESLQEAKIKELLKTYKFYKKALKNLDDKSESVEAERFWIGVVIEDLEWLLDDSRY